MPRFSFEFRLCPGLPKFVSGVATILFRGAMLTLWLPVAGWICRCDMLMLVALLFLRGGYVEALPADPRAEKCGPEAE